MVYTKVGKKVAQTGIFAGVGARLQEKGIYNTWMLEEQDTIQAFAKSYADRLLGEAFMEVIADNTGKGEEFGLESQHPIGPSALATNASPDLKNILEKL